MSREYAPTPGKWYENKEEEETFRVLTVDEDNELVEIEYVDGEIEELDLDTWHELDLELTEEPEGWAGDADDDEEDEEEEDFDEEMKTTTMMTTTTMKTTMKTKTKTTTS